MKSNVSDHLEILRCIYTDACSKCIAEVSDLRDLMTIESRAKSEGLSFLTITLPSFCSDFERSLADGYIGSKAFRSFRKARAIPAFLQGMLSHIFDHETGRIIDEYTEDISTIVESVRQICLAFKKLATPCTSERTQKALSSYTTTEHELKSFSVPKSDHDEFLHVSDVLWGNMLGNLCLDMLVSRHGPGATAERTSGNQKYHWRFWHERLDPYFPFIDTAYSISAGLGGKEIEDVTFLSQEQEYPVRVITVPKTLKAPRIIAIEPCCMQYTQQAVRDALYRVIEGYWLTAGHINFRDQSVNQKLALDSSSTGRFATIDLSDASDRVPRDLALEMFRSNPDLMDAIDACRSTKAEMPSGSIIDPLYKFASMGSALCFPVEAMYFYTLSVMALLVKHDLPVSLSNIHFVTRDIYVYGDDIVVPTDAALQVLDYLQKYNCKVNSSKTFLKGNFRESCGLDAFNGYPVTPVYIRKLRPQCLRQGSELISWTATANLFYLKGYWTTASHLFKQVEKILGALPYVSPESSALGRISLLGYRSIERWNRKLHRFEIKAWVPSPVYRSDSIDGYAALQKSLLRLTALNNDSTIISFDFESNSKSKTNSELSSRFVPQEDMNQTLKALIKRAKGVLDTPKDFDSLSLERTERRGVVALQHRWVTAS